MYQLLQGWIQIKKGLIPVINAPHRPYWEVLDSDPSPFTMGIKQVVVSSFSLGAYKFFLLAIYVSLNLLKASLFFLLPRRQVKGWGLGAMDMMGNGRGSFIFLVFVSVLPKRMRFFD